MPRDTVDEQKILAPDEALKELNKTIRNLGAQINRRKHALSDTQQGDEVRLSIFEEIYAREEERKKLMEERKKTRALLKSLENKPEKKPFVSPIVEPKKVKPKNDKTKPKTDKKIKPDDKKKPAVPINVLSNPSRARVFRPFLGGAAIGVGTTILAKIIATTALTTIVPFAAPVVGFAFGYGSNLASDRINGAKFFSTKTQMNALRTGFVAALGASIIPGLDLIGVDFGDIFNSITGNEAVTAAPLLDAPITEPAVPLPLEEAPSLAPLDNVETTPEPSVDLTPEAEPEELPAPAEAAPETTILPVDEIISLNANQIFDVGLLLDNAQGESDYVREIISHASANGVDPDLIAELQEKLDGGFDFIDSAGSATSAGVFNEFLAAGMDPSSPAGELVTSEEYGSLLGAFVEQLNQAEFITDTPDVPDDTYLDSTVRADHINKTIELRALLP